MSCAPGEAAAVRRAANLLLIAAARLGATTVPPPTELIDWAYLLHAAGHQGVAPLLRAWALARPDLAHARDLAIQLEPAYWGSHFKNRALLAELARVLRAAATASVPVMPLKGALLALRYYPTPALRPMSDVDLLVPAAALGALGEVLGGLGYAEDRDDPRLLDEARRDPRQREIGFTATRGGTAIRIECRSEPLDPMLWGLTELDRTLSSRLHRHAERMWARGTRDAFEGAPFVRIAAEDLLLHVASHLATRHGEFRLLWLHDLALVAAAHRETLDWDSLAATARDLRLAAPIHAALAAATRWADAPAPIPRLQRTLLGHGLTALPSRVEFALLTRRLERLDSTDLAAEPPDIERKLLSLLRLGGVRAWLRAARWALVPGGDYMVGWRGRPEAYEGSGYAAAVALRLLVIVLRATATAGRRLRVPLVPALLDRLLARLRRTASLDPFLISWPARGRGDGGP